MTMTDCDLLCAKIINESILTPVIYMVKNEYEADFICFCDRNLLMNEIYKTEERLKSLLNKKAVIIDIREFPEYDRLEILKTSTLIYYENEFVKQIFELSMVEDYKKMDRSRIDVLMRQKSSGTVYLS